MTSQTLIEAFISAAARRPDARFAAASDVRPCEETLAGVVEAGRRVGAHLTRLGVKPGDVVAVMLPSWREWLLTCVGAAQAGAVLLPIVTMFGAAELGFILRQSRARVLVTPDLWRKTDYRALIHDVGELPDLIGHVIVGARPPAEEGLAFADLETPVEIPPPAARGPDDLALLIYTSGTTADPKGVMHTSRGLLAEMAAQAEARKHLADEAVLSPWPPGHVAGALQLLRYLTQGVRVIAMDQWDAAQAAELIERYRITSSSGTPFHIAGILDAAERDDRDLASLTGYMVGAAPVPPSVVERCIARGVAVFHCYGSSEHPTLTMGDPDDPLDKRLHTEGRLMAGSEMRFVDDDGHDVPEGAEGEIVTRGPELFVGYFDSALNAAAFLPGGWYRTGDIGRADADGFLLITDRKKDIIIRGGENISSREVEDLLLTHPAVAEAAAVAAPDARMGEVVKVCVVLAPGASLALEDVRAHFREAGVAIHKTPERLEILAELPRNAAGKILKQALRRQAVPTVA